VQRQHAPAVLANRLLIAHRWGQPCRAYNVCIRPGSEEAAALAAIQASALRLEPSLLQVPERSLQLDRRAGRVLDSRAVALRARGRVAAGGLAS
jgi:hypothetical protein